MIFLNKLNLSGSLKPIFSLKANMNYFNMPSHLFWETR